MRFGLKAALDHTHLAESVGSVCLGAWAAGPSAARRVRSGISERTVAETRSNREDAPIAIVAK